MKKIFMSFTALSLAVTAAYSCIYNTDKNLIITSAESVPSAQSIRFEVTGSGKCTESTAKIDGYNTYNVKPGAEIQAVIAAVDSVDSKYDTISLRNSLGGLEYIDCYGPSLMSDCSSDESFVQCIGSYAVPVIIDKEKYDIISYTLKVPETAEYGDVFKVEWAPEDTYSFSLYCVEESMNTIRHEMIPAAFVVKDDEPENQETTDNHLRTMNSYIFILVFILMLIIICIFGRKILRKKK